MCSSDLVSLATASAVGYIQSESFAKIVREKLQASVVRNLGVELGFDRLKIGVLPPSISLVNVDLKVSDRQNKLGLSPSTVFRAGTLGFSFRMIQAFSNGIAVNKLFLGDAQVKLTLPKSKESSGGEKLSAMVQRPIHFQIMKGFEASIRQLEIRNSDVELSGASEEFYLRVKKIAYLAITPAAEGTNQIGRAHV